MLLWISDIEQDRKYLPNVSCFEMMQILPKIVHYLCNSYVSNYLGLCGGCSFLGCILSRPFSRGEGAPLCGEVGSSLASSTTSSWPISFSSFFNFLWSGSAGLRVLYFSLSPGEIEFLCNNRTAHITPQTNWNWQYWTLLVQIPMFNVNIIKTFTGGLTCL